MFVVLFIFSSFLVVKYSFFFNVRVAKVYKLVSITSTIMESKENKILNLFFDYPSKEWHFEEIVKKAEIARGRANEWLKRFVKDNLIKRVKTQNKMPHYISNYFSCEYKNKKRVFAFTKLYESKLLNHLASLQNAKTVILFGSFSRSDWYKNSDVDVFIYGDPDGLKIADYEARLGRDVHLFVCQNNEELKRLGAGLIRNILQGNVIKGNLDFIKVSVSA